MSFKGHPEESHVASLMFRGQNPLCGVSLRKELAWTWILRVSIKGHPKCPILNFN